MIYNKIIYLENQRESAETVSNRSIQLGCQLVRAAKINKQLLSVLGVTNYKL